MAYTRYKLVNFGPGKAGLATVGYTLTGDSRITAGVAESPAGSGVYGATVSFADAFDGSITWDTGESTPAYAAEDVGPGPERLDVAVSTRLATAGYTAPPTAAGIADAVWDEARAGHVTAGTFGEVLEGSDGTVASATSTTVGLGASAPAIDLTGLSVRIVSGLGAPQERRITAYDTGTKVATIAPAWGVTPDVTSTYLIGGRDVWSNDTRTLTDKAGFKLASDGLGLCAADANVTVVELLRRIGATTAGVETRPTATTVAYAAVGAPSTVLVTGTINATTGIRESVTYS